MKDNNLKPVCTAVNNEIKSLFDATILFKCITIGQVFLLVVLGTEVGASPKINSLLIAVAIIQTLALFYFKEKIISKIIANDINYKIFILINLSIDFLLMAVGGGWRNSWYIFTFSTILFGATFKKLSGGMITAFLLSLVYITSLIINDSVELFKSKDMLDQVISNIISYFLIGGFFAYPALLLEKLHKTRVELENKATALKEADELIEHFKNHSVNLKEALISVLEPNNFLEIINKNVDLLKGTDFNKDGLIPPKPLSQKEKEILTYLSNGLTNQEIANKIGASTHTIDSHRRNIYQKLGVNSSAQAIAVALSNRMLD